MMVQQDLLLYLLRGGVSKTCEITQNKKKALQIITKSANISGIPSVNTDITDFDWNIILNFSQHMTFNFGFNMTIVSKNINPIDVTNFDIKEIGDTALGFTWSGNHADDENIIDICNGTIIFENGDVVTFNAKYLNI